MHSHNRTALGPLVNVIGLILLALISLVLSGCIIPNSFEAMREEALENMADQGGYDGIVMDLPMSAGAQALCTQGADDEPTHDEENTRYDLDFDTDNGKADLVFAPIGGVAHVHTESSQRNFGYHVNVDLDDGSYVVIAHLSDVFIEDGVEVAAGQLIGFEGCAGECGSDHVHIGRHFGDAALAAEYGTSVEVGYFMSDVTSQEDELALGSQEFECGADGAGHLYESHLPVTFWHPNGTLIKTPDEPDIYLLEDGQARRIETEEVFWALGYDWGNVALVSPEELACYERGETIGKPEDVIFAVENVFFRDGDLVKEVDQDDLYVISDGLAAPIETWETFLRLGFGSRSVTTLDTGTISDLGVPIGSCQADFGCVDAVTIETCGGSLPKVGDWSDEEEEDDQEDENTDHDSYLPDDQIEDGGTTDTAAPDDDDGQVEICYLPGETMAEGEFYLDGPDFTMWVSPVADTAASGDTTMCATVTATSGQEIKMNAWYATSVGGEVFWAAYNDWCQSIEFRGRVTVDGADVTVTTAPWSASEWATNPCAIGGDAFFTVP